MYPVYFNSKNENLLFESFKDKLIEICNEHRDNNKALAFAFIIYNLENAQIPNILQNQNWWNALNESSGEYLSIFTLHLRPNRRGRVTSRNYNPNLSSFMTSVPTNYNVKDGFKELVNKYFGTNIEISYPSLLFFQVDDQTIIDTLLIELEEKFTEPAFRELQIYIQKAVVALERITPAYRNNYKEIFDNLEYEVAHAKAMRKTKRFTKKGMSILGFASSLSGFTKL